VKFILLTGPGDPDDESGEDDLDEDDPPPDEEEERIKDGEDEIFTIDDPDRNASSA